MPLISEETVEQRERIILGDTVIEGDAYPVGRMIIAETTRDDIFYARLCFLDGRSWKWNAPLEDLTHTVSRDPSVEARWVQE